MFTVIKRVSHFEQQMDASMERFIFRHRVWGFCMMFYRNAHHYVGCGVYLYDDGCLSNGAYMRVALMETNVSKYI